MEMKILVDFVGFHHIDIGYAFIIVMASSTNVRDQHVVQHITVLMLGFEKENYLASV